MKEDLPLDQRRGFESFTVAVDDGCRTGPDVNTPALSPKNASRISPFRGPRFVQIFVSFLSLFLGLLG